MTDTRTPPADLEAEQALLYALLMGPAAGIEEVRDLGLAPGDLYRLDHQAILHGILAMAADGAARIDAIVLTHNVRASAGVDVHDAVLEVLAINGTVSNVGRYTRIVMQHAAARHLIEVASHAIERVYGREDPGDVADDMIDQAGAIHAPSDAPPRGHMTWDELGNVDLDQVQPWVVPGLFRQQWRIIGVGPEGHGKALELSTPVLTALGWRTMGSLRVGEEVFGPDGATTVIVACSEVHEQPSYRLCFDDGSSVVAGESHLWETVDYHGRQEGRWHKRLRTTAEIAATVKARAGHTTNHLIPCADPVCFPETELPIDPWLLGYWLGNGSTIGAKVTCHSDDEEFVVGQIAESGYRVSTRYPKDGTLAVALGIVGQPRTVPGWRKASLVTHLRQVGVLGDKHVPDAYLTAAPLHRLALLQGLVDSDGHVTPGDGVGRGQGAAVVEVCFTNQKLAAGTLELALGLGIKATMNEGDAKIDGRFISRRWRISFQSDLPVASLPRKAERLIPLRTRRSRCRYIVACEPVGVQRVRCIQVDRSDGMWLAGPALIATHNSLLSAQLALCAAAGVHPLSFEPIEPQRTLTLMLENRADTAAHHYDLVQRALRRYTSGRPIPATVWHRPEGIDLRSARDRAAFVEVLGRDRPTLVCLCPAYKSFKVERGENYEQATGATMRVLDELMARYHFAIFVEHHAGKKYGGSRDLDPSGSAWWLRWPEIGLRLKPDGTPGTFTELAFERFRGDRVPNEWPVKVVRGREWPWEGVWDAGHFAK